MRRALTADEQNNIAWVNVDELALHYFRIERGPPSEGASELIEGRQYGTTYMMSMTGQWIAFFRRRIT
jgi:hypothetical protein